MPDRSQFSEICHSKVGKAKGRESLTSAPFVHKNDGSQDYINLGGALECALEGTAGGYGSIVGPIAGSARRPIRREGRDGLPE